MSQIEEIEISMAEAQKMVDKKDQLLKLMSNRGFNKIIVEGYFKEEAARLASVAADPNLTEHREEIWMQIQAISCLQNYLRTINMMGTSAEQEVSEAREHIAEIEMYAEEDGE